MKNTNATGLGHLFTEAEERLSGFPETSRLLRYLADNQERPGFFGLRVRFLADYIVDCESRPGTGVLNRMDDCGLVAEIAGFGIRKLNSEDREGHRYMIGDSEATADEAIDILESEELGKEPSVTKRKCVDMSRVDIPGTTPSMEFPRLRLLTFKNVPWLSAEESVALAESVERCGDGDRLSACSTILSDAKPGDGFNIAKALTMSPKDVSYDEWHRLASWIAAPDGVEITSDEWWPLHISKFNGMMAKSPESTLAFIMYFLLTAQGVLTPTVSDLLDVREYPIGFVAEEHKAKEALLKKAHQ